jgi:hypothetical protein
MYFDLDKGNFVWTVKTNDGGFEALVYTALYGDDGYGET